MAPINKSETSPPETIEFTDESQQEFTGPMETYFGVAGEQSAAGFADKQQSIDDSQSIDITSAEQVTGVQGSVSKAEISSDKENSDSLEQLPSHERIGIFLKSLTAVDTFSSVGHNPTPEADSLKSLEESPPSMGADVVLKEATSSADESTSVVSSDVA